MIISVEELKNHIMTDLADSVLEEKLRAIESMIRKRTNNNFQHRNQRFECPVMAQNLYSDYPHIHVGDTIEISKSIFNDGVYFIKEIEDGMLTLDRKLLDENNVRVTKVVYPYDVKLGAINLMKWELENRSKVGIQSETISRHSVTYFDMSGDNSAMGYPKSLLGFLEPYMKARF